MGSFSTSDEELERFATFGEGRRFRYVLGRRFLPRTGALLRLCVWLNPSQADEVKDDASVRIGMGFARRWGDGGILIVNVCDLVETYSEKLPPEAEWLGPEHWGYVDEVLRGLHGLVRPDVLCGWGDLGAGPIADETVRRIRAIGFRPVALKLTKSGNPGHPLRKKADLTPEPFQTPTETRLAWGRAVSAARKGSP